MQGDKQFLQNVGSKKMMLGAKVYTYSSLENEKGFLLEPEISYSHLYPIHPLQYILRSDVKNGIRYVPSLSSHRISIKSTDDRVV